MLASKEKQKRKQEDLKKDIVQTTPTSNKSKTTHISDKNKNIHISPVMLFRKKVDLTPHLDTHEEIEKEIVNKLMNLSARNFKLLDAIYTATPKEINQCFTYENIKGIAENLGAKVSVNGTNHRKFEFKDFTKSCPHKIHHTVDPHGGSHNSGVLLGVYVTKFQKFLQDELGISEELYEKAILNKQERSRMSKKDR